MTKAVAGISDRCGWAEAVCVAKGEVIDRRRIELIEPGLPNMPYHHDAQGLPADEAEALIERVSLSAALCARRGLESLPAGVGAIAIRKRPPLPATIVERIASYHAQTRADGVMYREALAESAQPLGWSVMEYEARTVFREAAEALGLDDISPRLDKIGKALGRPWRKDHQLATTAAIAVSRLL